MHSWLNNAQNIAFLFYNSSPILITREKMYQALHACTFHVPASQALPVYSHSGEPGNETTKGLGMRLLKRLPLHLPLKIEKRRSWEESAQTQ